MQLPVHCENSRGRKGFKPLCFLPSAAGLTARVIQHQMMMSIRGDWKASRHGASGARSRQRWAEQADESLQLHSGQCAPPGQRRRGASSRRHRRPTPGPRIPIGTTETGQSLRKEKNDITASNRPPSLPCLPIQIAAYPSPCLTVCFV
jgi:hypothetical protein